jgi:hypothetical protein
MQKPNTAASYAVSNSVMLPFACLAAGSFLKMLLPGTMAVVHAGQAIDRSDALNNHLPVVHMPSQGTDQLFRVVFLRRRGVSGGRTT